MPTDVSLPPELERFADACVASGRYGSLDDVMRSALRLLQDAEERRQRFSDMLDEVRAEAERDGRHSVGSVLAEMDEIIGQYDDSSG